jgi:hypothetical protein
MWPIATAIEWIRYVSEELLFVGIAFGDGGPFYAQGRLRHPHMLPDGGAKLLG